jgi:hypothetical protein
LFPDSKQSLFAKIAPNCGIACHILLANWSLYVNNPPKNAVLNARVQQFPLESGGCFAAKGRFGSNVAACLNSRRLPHCHNGTLGRDQPKHAPEGFGTPCCDGSPQSLPRPVSVGQQPEKWNENSHIA